MKGFKSFFQEMASALAARKQAGARAAELRSEYTPRAEQALALAAVKAKALNHNFIGTEHVLLGIIELEQGVAVSALNRLNVDLEQVRREVEKYIGCGPELTIHWTIPLTPRTKKVMALARAEAKSLSHTYVGTEHILLGLISEGDGVAARVLKGFVPDVATVRDAVINELEQRLLDDGEPPEAGGVA